ncbi:hypothetical protein CR513_10921, partial [Mucuna pruriens]
MEDVLQENVPYENLMEMMMNDAFGHYRQQDTNVGVSQPLGEYEFLNGGSMEKDHSDFYELLNDENQSLYEGSTYTKLEFIIKLYHTKVLCGLNAFEEVKLPPSIYEAKKITNKLGLNYTKIDACPKDYMLYLGDDEINLEACKYCGTSRWNPDKKKKRYLQRHPRDGVAWKKFDLIHLEFASDSQNVCLGFTTNDFNPSRTLSSTYSI